ncbi:UNKNOWN [Stylonychia lemnae]|uniref:Dynein light chain n=1 Tax=Stylonychia lemnae TaxID=5949 RepID=A0A078A7D5_STYLE|nr:UNKNOWN [Stylonychia lemnae]|eukprot:CDW78159.1 UNKNOWN [Stylonychia lemnae]
MQKTEYQKKRMFSTYQDAIKVHAENVVESFINSKEGKIEYEPTEAQKWTKTLATDITNSIQGQPKLLDQTKFKLKVDVMILDRDSVGFHMSSSCLWDNDADGSINFQKETESYYIIVSIFGFFRH